MMPCGPGMVDSTGHLPRVHMRPTGGLARTTLTTFSTTGGSVKGRPCADADTHLLQPYVRLVRSGHGDSPGSGVSMGICVQSQVHMSCQDMTGRCTPVACALSRSAQYMQP